MLITDPTYRLPRLTALRFEKTLENGANKPGLLTARDLETRQSFDCVVKFRGAERMSPEACARELLAAFIAKQLGCWTGIGGCVIPIRGTPTGEKTLSSAFQ